MADTPLTIQRTHPLPEGDTALEARMPDGQRVTVWPGYPRYKTATNHPWLAEPLLDGTNGDQPVWVETRPGPWSLPDLHDPMDEATALELVCGVADALGTLHATGRAHGSVREDHIVLHSDGSPCLIGIGRFEGNPQQDIEQAIALLQRLFPDEWASEGTLSASGLAARLRERAIERHLPESRLAALLAEQGFPRAAETQTITLNAIPMGPSDEVQPDIGLDSAGRGLLDRWAPLETSGELTDDPTDTAEISRHDQPTHHALLGRVSSLLDSAEARHTETFAPPGSHFRNFLLSEPLDPLPLSNGLPHGLLHNPSDHSEQTAEVSQPDITNPSLEPFSETKESTGQTGDIPIQASVLTGLLWATVIGMMAAAIMLLAVWLIISGVF